MATTETAERDVIRSMAERLAEIADGQENHLAIQRWRDVNALRKPDRAPVWCRPVGCWGELLPDSEIVCTDPFLRGIEVRFRRALIKLDIGDDSPVADHFPVGVVFDVDPPNRWGVEVVRRSSGVAGGSWKYEPPLKSEADFDRLRIPQLIYNEAETARAMERTEELLADILPVRLVCPPPGTATVGGAAADLRGLTQMMMDTLTAPELLHRLMAHIRDAALAALDAVAATGLLTANNDGPMLCSDPVGQTPDDGKVTYANCWIHGNSQEFDQVSPAMWEEFCLNYQRPLFERFGYVHYGCCENLTHKIDGVLSIPNLRIFTCSAWTDLDTIIDRCGGDYVIMWRQKASDVVFPDDIETIANDLDEGARRLKGCRYQIVLRELQTLVGHPDRLHRWTALAKEAAERYA